ncbi:MAG: hypothetical protein QM796_05290 [Chthoniobacteraceae bacterium]
MNNLIRIFLVLILSALWVPMSGAQTLGEILRAVQNRRKVQVEGYDADQLVLGNTADNPMKLIDWELGADFPADSQVNALSISAKIALLKKAWKGYYGSGYDASLDRFGKILTPENFHEALEYYAASLKKQNRLPWFWEADRDAEQLPTYGKNQLAALPSSPLQLNALNSTNWRFDTLYSDLEFPEISANYYLDSSESSSSNWRYEWSEMAKYPSQITTAGPTDFDGYLELTETSAYGMSVFNGMASTSFGSRSDPGEHLIADAAFEKQSVPQDLTGGDLGLGPGNGITINGNWVNAGSNSWYFDPQLPGQSNVDFYQAGYGGVLASFTVYIVPTFGQEFLSTAPLLPEEPQSPEIIPELSRNRLKIKLGNTPATDCDLIWDFSEAPFQYQGAGVGLVEHRHLKVEGSGKWDAVYSSKAADREPVIQWPSSSSVSYKRWSSFPAYIGDWFFPVLKQLKTSTYTLNVSQVDAFSYRIDFYFSSQVGAKDSATGLYSISGLSPVDSIIVENPLADDDAADWVRITTNKAVYDLTLNPENDRVTWNLSAWDQATSNVFLDEEVIDKYADYEYIDNFYTIVLPFEVDENVSLDGVALPKVTTSYWDTWANPLRIDAIIESGDDGTRTTSYTYDWEEDDDDNMYLPRSSDSNSARWS